MAVCALLLLLCTARAQQQLSPLEQGAQLAQQNRLAEAEAPLAEAYRQDPHGQALRLYAQVEARLGKLDHALALFEAGVKQSPRDAELRLAYALALADATRPRDALAQLDEAERLAPASFAVHFNRARLLEGLNQTAQAELEYRAADKVRPGDPECLNEWATLERKLNHHEQEQAILERWVRLEPTRAEALFRLGRDLCEQDHTQQGLPLIERSAQLDPNNPEAAYWLSKLLRTTDPDKASEWAHRYQELRQQRAGAVDVRTLGNQAVEAASKADWNGAIALYQQALTACQDCTDAAALHKDLGLALCHAGRLQAGLDELRQAWQLDPNDPDTLRAFQVLHAQPPAPGVEKR